MTLELTTISVNPFWLRDILDLVGNKVFVAGGAARYIAYMNDVLDEEPPEPGDIDLFRYFEDDYPPHIGVLLNTKLGYRSSSRTPHSTEFRKEGYFKVQIINPHANAHIKMWGSVGEVLDQFDFRMNQFAVHKEGAEYILTYSSAAIEDTEKKQIVLHHCNNPIAMCHRAAKYVAKGYHIAPTQWLKIFEGWDNFDQEWKHGAFQLMKSIDPLDYEELSYRLLG